MVERAPVGVRRPHGAAGDGYVRAVALPVPHDAEMRALHDAVFNEGGRAPFGGGDDADARIRSLDDRFRATHGDGRVALAVCRRVPHAQAVAGHARGQGSGLQRHVLQRQVHALVGIDRHAERIRAPVVRIPDGPVLDDHLGVILGSAADVLRHVQRRELRAVDGMAVQVERAALLVVAVGRARRGHVLQQGDGPAFLDLAESVAERACRERGLARILHRGVLVGHDGVGAVLVLAHDAIIHAVARHVARERAVVDELVQSSL